MFKKRKYRWDDIDRFMLIFAAIFLAAIVFIFSSCGASSKLKTSSKRISDSTASSNSLKHTASGQEGTAATSKESSNEKGVELTFEDDPVDKAKDLALGDFKGDSFSQQDLIRLYKDINFNNVDPKTYRLKINGNEIESSRPIMSAKFNSKELQKTTSDFSRKKSESYFETAKNDVHAIVDTEDKLRAVEREGFPWVKVILSILFLLLLLLYIFRKKLKIIPKTVSKIFPDV